MNRFYSIIILFSFLIPSSNEITIDNCVSFVFKTDREIYYPGENILSIFEGDYNFTVLSDDILPYVENVTISSNSEFSIYLDWYDYLFSDEFEDLENWEIALGDWHSDDGWLKSQYSLTYPNFIPTGPMQLF